MDEINTKRNIEINFSVVFTDHYFGSGKYPPLAKYRKVRVNRDQQ